MLETSDIELLHSGCALIVGLVTADGAPFATRGWGLTIDETGGSARLVLDATAFDRLGHGSGGAVGSRIAVTGCSVLTLEGRQLKGPIVALEPVTDDDIRCFEAYRDGYFGDVAVVDAIPGHLMQRMVPDSFVACVFEITEVYNQTPGPGAGAVVGGAASR